jgi:hypothetical protein
MLLKRSWRGPGKVVLTSTRLVICWIYLLVGWKTSSRVNEGWGRAPICKASKPDHRLGIRATCNIFEEGKK